MSDTLLTVDSPKLFYTSGRQLTVDAPLALKAGITALTGPNGSGKTTFAKIIEKGRNFRTNRITSPPGTEPKIKYLEFNDIHSLAGMAVEYYQQRYEATMNEAVPYIIEILGNKCLTIDFRQLCEDFGLHGVEKKRINSLSSGELRKFLIINALCERPDLLILDNPYIGLDRESKLVLDSALLQLKKTGRSVLLLLPEIADAPVFTDNFLYTDSLKISPNPFSLDQNEDLAPNLSNSPFILKEKEAQATPVCELIDCDISYGTSVIIRKLDWTIKSGEKWSLSGPNGSGKSTLLSLINADNPQGYRQNLRLFGKKRGSGESIWEIKKQIGYVSPEMQLHFHGDGTVLQIVANGLNDTVGLYVKPTESQLIEARKWLRFFKLEHLGSRLFRSLSSGERQMVLIARSFIKQPRLLILDEPMHALDRENRALVNSAICLFIESHPDAAFIMVTHNPSFLPPVITHHLNLSHTSACK